MPKTDRERLEDNNTALLRIKGKAQDLPDAHPIVNVNDATIDGNTLVLSGAPDLPYIPLEYIQSTGTQWLDTNYMPVIGDELELRNVTTENMNGTVFSAGTGDYQLILILFKEELHDVGYFKYFSTGGAEQFYEPFLTNGNIKVYNNSLYYNDTLKATSSSAGGVDTSLKLFIRANGNNPLSMKLSRFIITNGGVTKRDFISVKRKSDNEICMYDKITETFFTNQGTGSFIAGPEI